MACDVCAWVCACVLWTAAALLEMPVMDYMQHIRLMQDTKAQTHALVTAIPHTATYADAMVKLDTRRVHRWGCDHWSHNALPTLCGTGGGGWQEQGKPRAGSDVVSKAVEDLAALVIGVDHVVLLLAVYKWW